MRSVAVVLPSLVVASVLIGCSSSAVGGKGGSGRDRLDVLTSYSLALSERNYAEAATYLGPADRAQLAGADGSILPEYRERVRAIRRSTLLNNPLVEVRDGLIYGIRDILPVLDVGREDSLAAFADAGPVAAPAPDPAQSDSAIQARRRQELKRTADAFFTAVSKRDWSKALGYLDSQERQSFLDARGKVKSAARARLAEADTSEWEALTLKEGKLTGVVLIIPARADSRTN